MSERMDCDSSVPDEASEFDAVEHDVELETDDLTSLGLIPYVHEDALPIEVEGNYDSSDEASEEEGEYIFQFEGEMDPLAFAEEEDESGMQPYQRFEKIQQHHYELLAAKKRQATSTSGMPAAKRTRMEEEDLEANFDEIMESMGYGGRRRKSKKNRQKHSGRRRGSKNKAKPEVTRKLGEATLCCAAGRNEEAIRLLKEVILLSPNLSDSYSTLGLIYDSMGDQKRSLNFYMIAAHLSPKDVSLWELLVARSVEQGDKNLASYCLGKAITADPENIDFRLHRAGLFLELGEYFRAAETYQQILRVSPDNIEALRLATELYKRAGVRERAVGMLKAYLSDHVNNADSNVVVLLVSLLMETNKNAEALAHIERAQQALCAGEQIPLDLTVKAGICHLHLGHLDKAEASFNVLQLKNMATHPQLIIEVADALMTAEQYESALKYYKMLEQCGNRSTGYLYLKIARCYAALTKSSEAIKYYYKAIQELDNNIDARMTLSSLLLEEGRDDEAISVLSPPAGSVILRPISDTQSDTHSLWWRSGKIKLKLSQIYKSKGSTEHFVDAIFPVIRETLFVETIRQKAKVKPRLSRGEILQRVKVIDQHQTDTVFQGIKPLASSVDRSKAARARRLLQKKDALKEEKRAAALAAGYDWKSDDDDNSEYESPQVLRESPLPDLLKDELHLHLIIDLCKSLSSLERYWDALEIINLSLKLASSTLSVEIKEELQTLGAQIAYHIDDPAHGWDYVRQIVMRHPHSISAWNCCYKVILRNSGVVRSRDAMHRKFLHHLKVKYKDNVPPIVISGNLFTLISQYQAATREYLEAYKLMPDNPLVNLCVGTSLINLALDFRLQNKHQTVLQGLAFLFNNARLCNNSQESLYNIARAYHHIGMVTLAVTYYEKVLEMREKDHPIPSLANENLGGTHSKSPGYCDLRREAAFNLHLIYKKSGAHDLARQVLKDHLTF